MFDILEITVTLLTSFSDYEQTTAYNWLKIVIESFTNPNNRILYIQVRMWITCWNLKPIDFINGNEKADELARAIDQIVISLMVKKLTSLHELDCDFIRLEPQS